MTTTVQAPEETKPPGDLRRWRYAERSGYALSVGALVAGAVVVTFCRSTDNWGWNAAAMLALAVTGFGAAVAVTIYRLQTQQAAKDSATQETLLGAVRETVAEAAKNAASAAREAVETRMFVEGEMRGAKEASAAPGPEEEGDEDFEDSGSETDLPDVDEAVDFDDAGADDPNVIPIEGDGVYLRPPAVPLKVLADLFSWWRGPAQAKGSWTVGNLVGAFRPYNKNQNLQGVPWILTFRRTNGELAEYRVAYSGRRRKGEDESTPSVSRYEEAAARWFEDRPTSDGV